MQIRFVFDDRPETTWTSCFDTPNSLASSVTSSSFAAPSTGGELSFTFKAPSCSPRISLFDDRGIARTSNVIEPSVSRPLINLRVVNGLPLLYARLTHFTFRRSECPQT